MSRVRWMSGVIAVMTVLICSPAFATAYTSNNSGDWNVGTTWAPVGTPGLGDTVTITGSHVITVSDAQSIDFITFLNNSGGKELHVTSTGTLTVAGSGDRHPAQSLVGRRQPPQLEGAQSRSPIPWAA